MSNSGPWVCVLSHRPDLQHRVFQRRFPVRKRLPEHAVPLRLGRATPPVETIEHARPAASVPPSATVRLGARVPIVDIVVLVVSAEWHSD